MDRGCFGAARPSALDSSAGGWVSGLPASRRTGRSEPACVTCTPVLGLPRGLRDELTVGRAQARDVAAVAAREAATSGPGRVTVVWLGVPAGPSDGPG
jgi:hypothetical protein